jgi:azurin
MTPYLRLFSLLLAVSSAACSASGSADSGPGVVPAGSPGNSAAAAKPANDGRPIEITGSDAMRFSITEITARPGDKLSVTLVNAGTTPKFSMGHNWVLVAPGTDIQAFLVAAAEAVTTDYVPADAKEHILASTKLLGPNERDTVTFTAPTNPGRYEFVCSFPGHYQVGMRGVLIVQ